MKEHVHFIWRLNQEHSPNLLVGEISAEVGQFSINKIWLNPNVISRSGVMVKQSNSRDSFQEYFPAAENQKKKH
jgi:hypothetical protein